jgi:hypothetical protein
MYGCEIVCAAAIRNGESSYVNSSSASGTNRSRGPVAIAQKTSDVTHPACLGRGARGAPAATTVTTGPKWDTT